MTRDYDLENLEREVEYMSDFEATEIMGVMQFLLFLERLHIQLNSLSNDIFSRCIFFMIGTCYYAQSWIRHKWIEFCIAWAWLEDDRSKARRAAADKFSRLVKG